MSITTRNIPGAAQTPQSAAAAARARLAPELSDNVVAKPLGQLASDSFVLKDKAFELRLVNYSVGEKESKMRFHEMKAKGYIPVKEDELEAGGGFFEKMDGVILVGDCILMKIPKAAILGQKKYNWEKAMRRRGFKNATDAAQEAAASDIRGSGAANSQLKKISVFVPGQKTVDALVGSDADTK